MVMGILARSASSWVVRACASLAAAALASHSSTRLSAAECEKICSKGSGVAIRAATMSSSAVAPIASEWVTREMRVSICASPPMASSSSVSSATRSMMLACVNGDERTVTSVRGGPGESQVRPHADKAGAQPAFTETNAVALTEVVSTIASPQHA